MGYDFTYDNTPELHRRVVTAIAKHAGVTRRLVWIVLAVPVIMTISNALSPVNRSSIGRFLSVVAPWWIIYPTLFFVFIKWSTYRSAKRTLSEDATHQGIQNRRLDDSGLHLRNSVMNADVSWTAIQSARETPDFFLLFQNRNCAYALLKQALRDASPADVRALLSAKLSDRARLLAN